MKSAVKAALITVSVIALLALTGCSLYRLVVTSQIKDEGRMENPDAYRTGKELVEFEWRQNHRNYYSSFSLKFYQENDMPLLTGWFPSQSGGDEIRESQTDAFSDPIPWQLTWVQWFELQNMLAESDLPAYRKPSSDSYDEVDSEIRIVWRTDDGDEAQTLSGSHAEALEALVLGIAEEAYAASKLETEQREVRETAELVGIYWEQNASSARDCFSFLLDERTMHAVPDFIGVNSYNGSEIAAGPDGAPVYLPRPQGFACTALKWPITPEIMEYGYAFLYERYQLPLYVTECGLSCNDHIFLDGQVHDADRIDFLHRYLLALYRGCERADIRGFFHWSLTDNFEWHSGYAERFGLIYVDYPTQKRILKDSARWYAQTVRENGKNLQRLISAAQTH